MTKEMDLGGELGVVGAALAGVQREPVASPGPPSHQTQS